MSIVQWKKVEENGECLPARDNQMPKAKCKKVEEYGEQK